MKNTHLTLALDVMGGDYGPPVTLPAARQILQTYPNLKLILIGHHTHIQPFQQAQPDTIASRIELLHTDEVITMQDKPHLALRNKKRASMRLALELTASGKADACVSAGNTGALMALSRHILKTLPGIDRPALTSPLPTITGGKVHLLDLGANIECDSETLFQFALMGAAMVEQVEQIKRPRVALLNIGTEAIKGNDQIKQTAQLLAASSLINYVGYIEGNTLFDGDVDLVVCDGFAGNICLKATEGAGKLLLSKLQSDLALSSWRRKLLNWLVPGFSRLAERMNPDQYNGASLLGLRAIVVKSHGHADVDAFCSALQVAIVEAQRKLPEHITAFLEETLQDSE